VTRWEAYTTICSFLRAGLLGADRELSRDLTWELIIEVASFHHVTPALARCLKNEGDVPADVRDYFEAALALNMQRNERMLSGLARIAGLLNAIDIEPLLLKGVAHLVEGIYPTPALRMLGDVDILIPVTRSAEAVAALEAAGFGTKSSDVVPPPTHHHLPILHDPETGSGVELHTDVISRSADAVISTAWFCEMARPILFRGHRVRLPEPTRNVGHTIFHSEVFHEGYYLNKIQLRHLLDTALIQAHHARAIDWNELEDRFSAGGLGELLATYLHCAAKLVGQPAPNLRHAPRRGAIAELRNTESRDGFHFQIDFLKMSRDNLQTELSRTMSDRDRFQSEVGRLRTELDNANRARGELERHLAGFQSQAEQLRTELENATRTRGKLERTLAEFQSQAEQLRTELENATGTRGELERHLAAILSSLTWRLTQPLRTVVGAARRWLQ
jgi:Uncharacterised nucleotidyltransferase